MIDTPTDEILEKLQEFPDLGFAKNAERSRKTIAAWQAQATGLWAERQDREPDPIYGWNLPSWYFSE